MAVEGGVFAEQGVTRKFGAFLGVFTPSVLTILGVIMYLRFGWVVAHAGLGGALAIVAICSGIAFFTSLSASAVATNSRLGAGGEYYMLSRSLGLTIGGAIGIPLFLCYVLSITLYCYGLAEALLIFWPAGWGEAPVQWAAAALIVLTIAISGRSANAALRLQLPLMALVGLSLAALTFGVFAGPLQAPEFAAQPERLAEAGGFWAILAVFFPAVTGFSAGIGMSGDLKDPQRDIPRGTLAAVTVGTVVYLSVPVLLAISGKVTVEDLAAVGPDTSPVWTRIAVFGGLLVFPGMWGAILSSAFGSALAGPRVLQALARDGLVPGFLGRSSATGQPTVATWAAGAIALSAVAMGSLNTVAQLVTILFLTLYMSENLVAAMENLVGNPSYRPTLRIHWAVSMTGVVGILAVMFLISPSASICALALEAAVYLYLRKKHLLATWGDVWAGVWGSLARFSLHRLARQAQHPKNWRPNILLFADQLEKRTGQLRMAAWFNQNRGILTVCDVLAGRPEDYVEEAARREAEMAEIFAREGILAFGEVDVMEDFEGGSLDVVQANGVGAMRANTVAFGWPAREEKLTSLLKIVRRVGQLGKASLIIHSRPAEGPQRFERVDIWWRGKYKNGDLMLLLAYLLTMNPLWRNAEIHLRSIVTKDMTRPDIEESLAKLIGSVRIKARQDVIVLAEGKSVVETMQEASAGADVVFIGMVPPQEGEEEAYARRLAEMLGPLPTTVLVHNSGPFRGQLL